MVIGLHDLLVSVIIQVVGVTDDGNFDLSAFGDETEYVVSCSLAGMGESGE